MASEETRTHGYTDESLRMLKTEEGQTNAVFACFGSAAQHAQLFEQALGHFLSIYNRVANSAVSINDFEDYDAKVHEKTMGWLLREMQKFVLIENQDAVNLPRPRP